MKFWKVSSEELRSLGNKYKVPCCFLEQDNWNDYGYVTQFHLHYLDAARKLILIGNLKVLKKSRGEEKFFETPIPKSFSKLATDFYSLGQTQSYYDNLKQLQAVQYRAIVKGLRDIIFNENLLPEIKDDHGFKTSLLRFSEAEKLIDDAKQIFSDSINKRNQKKIIFEFKCQLQNAEDFHRLKLSFNPRDPVPGRVIALIGKNGTGKTQVLSRLANVISGFRPDEGIVNYKAGRFSKVIAVSYSVFDQFTKPRERSFSYKYCGLWKTGDAKFDKEKFFRRLRTAWNIIKRNQLTLVWAQTVWRLIGKNTGVEDYKKLFNAKELKNEIGKLSSGQMITLCILTEIVANIEKGSLILFDEPETHLHPNAIGEVMESLKRILEKFSSFAIVATHSPIVIQNIPAKYVRVIERDMNFPEVRDLTIESFGEGASTIMKEIFEVDGWDGDYRSTLKELADKFPIERIEKFLGNRLGFGPSVLFNSLSKGSKASRRKR